MTENKDSFKNRVWWVAKVLLWYFFYQVVCTYGFYGIDWCATWLTGGEKDLFFTNNAILSASLFLSALLMIWHLVTFGYVKISARIFSGWEMPPPPWESRQHDCSKMATQQQTAFVAL